jgi:6-phosphogluconolactonase (cycloisomerase 2 family)
MRIYLQTNDAKRNEIIAFERREKGMLGSLGRFPTGGRGSGKPHLASQSSVVVRDGRVVVTNAGSGEVSLFTERENGLELVATVGSGGSAPTSVAVHGELAYVLNNGGESNVTGFRIRGRGLDPIEGSTRPLSRPDADPAQAAFSPDGRTLVVTERGTDGITTFAVGEDGLLGDPVANPSVGATPYGFDFAGSTLVVTEAFGGAVGKAAASSYSLDGASLRPVSGSVANTRSEVCWAIASKDGRFVWVTNFGDCTISRYRVGAGGSLELDEAVAATTNLGAKGVRDQALSADGRFLYALDADARSVFGWRVGASGELDPVGSFEGLPETAAGLAAG